MHDRRGGFTLLEILVVIVVAGVLAAMILPTLGAGRQAAQVRDASQHLWQAARFAQQRAVQRKVPHRLVLLPEGVEGGPGFRVEARDDDGDAEDGYRTLSTGAFRPTRLPMGVTFGPMNVSGAEPTLDGRRHVHFGAGGDADAAAVVLLGGDDDRLVAHSVLIAPNTGRAQRVEAWIDTPPNQREDLDV
jgi:prepilin-type N-terminal cleavage/methylation domain-containing protein